MQEHASKGNASHLTCRNHTIANRTIGGYPMNLIPGTDPSRKIRCRYFLHVFLWCHAAFFWLRSGCTQEFLGAYCTPDEHDHIITVT
jgi:hypothetical protein